jgi:predicted enzyme related to lactoylglutathione lyase
VPIQCKVVLYPVSDVDKAKAFFTTLFAADPHVDSPYYVGFNVDGDEIGLLPGGHQQGMSGPVAFFDVDDIAASLDALREAGAQIVQEPTDVGAGLLVAKVIDGDGNDVGLRQLPR